MTVTALRSFANSAPPNILYLSPLDMFTCGITTYLDHPYLCAKLSMAALVVGLSV